jgi:hypothetical protein
MCTSMRSSRRPWGNKGREEKRREEKSRGAPTRRCSASPARLRPPPMSVLGLCPPRAQGEAREVAGGGEGLRTRGDRLGETIELPLGVAPEAEKRGGRGAVVRRARIPTDVVARIPRIPTDVDAKSARSGGGRGFRPTLTPSVWTRIPTDVDAKCLREDSDRRWRGFRPTLTLSPRNLPAARPTLTPSA